jgi:hypothetical protein
LSIQLLLECPLLQARITNGAFLADTKAHFLDDLPLAFCDPALHVVGKDVDEVRVEITALTAVDARVHLYPCLRNILIIFFRSLAAAPAVVQGLPRFTQIQ